MQSEQGIRILLLNESKLARFKILRIMAIKQKDSARKTLEEIKQARSMLGLNRSIFDRTASEKDRVLFFLF